MTGKFIRGRFEHSVSGAGSGEHLMCIRITVPSTF